MFLLNFRFYCRVSFQAGYGNQVHVVHGQFRQGRYQGLDKDIRLFGVDTYRKVVQSDLEYVFPDFFRIIRIVRQGLGVSNFDVNFIKLAGILEGCPFSEGSYIVTYVKVSGGTVAG